MIKKVQKPVNPQLKRVLKSAKKQREEEKASYDDIVMLAEKLPQEEFRVSGIMTSPSNVKKGIDRAIKRCGYSMTSNVRKGEVLIRKKK